MIQIQTQIAPPVVDGPLEHLGACHRRIEHRLNVLIQAAQLLPHREAEAIAAIENSLRFLDTSGALHTADEEESLFPRLRKLLSLEELTYLDGLEAQHREVERTYAALKEAAKQFSTDRSAEQIETYRSLASQLSGIYRAHIASEDATLMALAARTLTPDQLAAIQTEMRLRRR